MASNSIEFRYYMEDEGEGKKRDLMIDFNDRQLTKAFCEKNFKARLSKHKNTRVFIKTPSRPLYVRVVGDSTELCFEASDAVKDWRRELLFSSEHRGKGKIWIVLDCRSRNRIRRKLGLAESSPPAVRENVDDDDMGHAQGSKAV